MIQTQSIPTLQLPMFKQLLTALPLDGAIKIELVNNIPLFKVTIAWQKRLEFLLSKQQQTRLSDAEIAELDKFEEIDDYLSLVNRLIRNLWQHGIMPT